LAILRKRFYLAGSHDVTRADVIVVGGGIVGLATAHAVIHRHPRQRVLLLEKESALARHQTGHNSGVVHSGIYYPPGSLKAKLVQRSRQPLIDLADRHAVPISFPGKVIVATESAQLPRLRLLAERGREHRLAVQWLDERELRRIEPNASGIAALRVPEAGVTDFAAVAQALASECTDAGVDIRLGEMITRIEERADGVSVVATSSVFGADHAVVCAGLQSTRLWQQGLAPANMMILAFRGEYYELGGSAADLVRSMIYPVPDPRLPFLGVHLTRGIDGTVHVGPNAVPALADEGYRWRDIDVHYLRDIARFPGTRRLAQRYWKTGLAEIRRSLSKPAFVKEVQRLVPDLTGHSLRRAPAGVRAQAVRFDGSLVDDFVFRRSARVIRVDNAPSPAATAALAIGDHVADLL
jgi:(S)-2-hydroxyglutarate dehydrogenase